MEHEEMIDVIESVAGAVGGEVYEGYSGRGMFGRQCYGIVCSYAMKAIEEAEAQGLRGARIDSMGLHSIVYWPSVEYVRSQT